MKFSLPKRKSKDAVEEAQEAPVNATPADADENDEGGKKKRRRPKSDKPAKAKKVSYPRKGRFTLLIGDEGAILIYMKGNTVLSRQFVPDASPGNLDELRETIEKDNLAPITMIIDSIDQSFVQQTLPPVSSLSVNKLIKRRLDRDFKPEDIKGAIVLGRDKGGRKDWSFLMISVEKSPQLILWLNFIMTFDNRFRGIVLLSVEAGIFIKNLERMLGVNSKTGTGAEWKILVSHNKVGGFRQIILRNGRLIFTRLALPVGEPTPAVVAGHIEQEMQGTIEYLKRFGYNPRAGLDVYIIASQEVCEAVDSRRFDAQTFHAFSPNAVAEMLNIRGATQPSDQFGDVVLASAIGSIRRNTLKLTTPESRLYDKFQLWKYGQRLAATFAILGMVVYGAYIGYSTLILQSNLEDAEQKKRINEQALSDIKQKIANSKIDVEMVGNQIDHYKLIKAEVRTPIPFLTQLAQAIKPPVALKELSWAFGDSFPKEKVAPTLINFNLNPQGGATPGGPGGPGAPGMPGGMPSPMDASPGAPGAEASGVTPTGPAAQLPKDIVTAAMKIEFPAGLKSPKLFKKFSEDFLKDLHSVMKDYTIAYTNVPAEYLDIQSLQMSFDQSPSESTLGLQPVIVDIAIRGNMITGLEEKP